MKNQNLIRRFLYSLQGLKTAWQSEKSFRSQIVMTLIIVPTIVYLKASPIWWGVFLLTIGTTLAAELLNTALENLCDLVHPGFHPQIARAKDCAAAAVLILSLSSILIFLVFIYDRSF